MLSDDPVMDVCEGDTIAGKLGLTESLLWARH